MTDSQPLPPPIPPAPLPLSPAPPRRLRRTSRKAEGRKWLGVASGMADYMGVSRTATRWVFVLTCGAGGLGIILYLVAAVLIPTDTQPDPIGDRISHGRPDRLLAIIGTIALVIFAVLNSHSVDVVVATLLVCAGVYLWSTSKDGPAPLPQAGDRATVAPWAPPRSGVAAGASSGAAGSAGDAPSAGTGQSLAYVRGVVPTPVAATPDTRRSWGWAVFAAAIAAMVLLAPFTSAALVLTVGVGMLLAGMAVGMFAGRRRMWLLILPIMILGAFILPARWFGTAGVPLNAGAGQVLIGARDLGLTAADPSHAASEQLTAGHLRVDLRNAVSAQQLRFAVGTGQLDLEVPSDVSVTVHAKVGIGQIKVDGESVAPAGGPTVSVDVNGPEIQAGTDLDVTRALGPTVATRHLDIDARVGLGEIRVIRTAAEGGTK